jgi:hypothetical protein
MCPRWSLRIGEKSRTLTGFHPTMRHLLTLTHISRPKRMADSSSSPCVMAINSSDTPRFGLDHFRSAKD